MIEGPKVGGNKSELDKSVEASQDDLVHYVGYKPFVVQLLHWTCCCDILSIESDLVLRVSTLDYSTGSQNLEGFWTVASAHALHLPTITCPSISIAGIQKFGS